MDFSLLVEALEVSGDSSSRRTLKERARRSRPLSPPPLLVVCDGSSIAARSLSSRDIRLSAAVKFPWDSGEGRAGRGVAVAPEIATAEVDVVDVVVADIVGERAKGREEAVVAVDPEDEAEEFRWCGIRCGLGPEDVADDGMFLDGTEPLGRLRALPLAEGELWELCTL